MMMLQYQKLLLSVGILCFIFDLKRQVSAVAENDDCSDAIPVTIGVEYEGSTRDATFDNAGECGVSNTANGVWYMIVGSGNALTASTCLDGSFDTKLSVFSGNCGSLMCVGGDDDSCGRQSKVIWLSKIGTVYYILVHGFGGLWGDFTLVVESDSPLQLGPPNDVCAQATPLSIGQSLMATTTGSYLDFDACGSSAVSPGVWFTMTGNGRAMNISTCTYATFDTYISVFSGACTDLACVASNDDACGWKSTALFPTVANRSYYILVHGYQTEAGDFAISLGESLAPVNDFCLSAMEVFPYNEYEGSTRHANADTSITACGRNSAPGVWYSSMGLGFPITASTCSFSTYDTKISVYRGNCQELYCVASNDDFCDSGSEVEWETIAGEMYYILVHGFSRVSGDFSLRVSGGPSQAPTPAPTVAFSMSPTVESTPTAALSISPTVESIGFFGGIVQTLQEVVGSGFSTGTDMVGKALKGLINQFMDFFFSE